MISQKMIFDLSGLIQMMARVLNAVQNEDASFSGMFLVFSIKCKIERRHNIGGNAISTTGGFDPCRDPSVIHTSCLNTIPHTTCLCHNCMTKWKNKTISNTQQIKTSTNKYKTARIHHILPIS